MEAPSDKEDVGAQSIFKLEVIISTAQRDLEQYYDDYADVLLRLPDNSTVIKCSSSALIALGEEGTLGAEGNRSIERLIASVRNGEGKEGMLVNSFGNAILEYSIEPGDIQGSSNLETASIMELLDVRRAMPLLLSKALKCSEAASTLMGDPDISIYLEDDRTLSKAPQEKSAPVRRKVPTTTTSTTKTITIKRTTTPAPPSGKTNPLKLKTKGAQQANTTVISKAVPEILPVSPQPKPPPKKTVFRAHRFVLAMRIPYYRNLMTARGSLHFGDAKSGRSALPAPIFSDFAMKCVIQYAYDPSKIGDLFVNMEPHVLPYLKLNCKQYKEKEHLQQPPVPITSIKRFVEVVKAADYLGLEELALWSCKMLIDLGHGMDGGCTGQFCARIVPRILQELHECGGEIGCSEIEAVYFQATAFIASWPSKLWKRQLIVCEDEIIEDVLEEVDLLISGDHKEEKNRHRKQPSWLTPSPPKDGKGIEGDPQGAIENGIISRMNSLNINSGIHHCLAFYLDVLLVESAVDANASSPKLRDRWKTKLLQPVIENCLHVIAAHFDQDVIVHNVVHLAGGRMSSGDDDDDDDDQEPYISLDRPLALTLVSQVTISSPSDWDPPLDRPILTERTCAPLLRGLKRIMMSMPEFQEAINARQMVINYVRNNWLSMSLSSFPRAGMSSSPFAKWSWDEVCDLSKEVNVPPAELRGDDRQKKKTTTTTSGGGKKTNSTKPGAPSGRTISMRDRLDASRNRKA